MTNKTHRRPQVFDADDPNVRPSETVDETGAEATNDGRESSSPTEAAPTASGATADDTSGRSEPGHSETPTGPFQAAPEPRRRRFGFAGAFVSAVLLLSSLAIGLWFSRFVSIAVARDDWIGWGAKGLAIFIAAVIVLAVIREIIGFLRLSRLARIRREAEQAIVTSNRAAEARVVKQMKRLASGRASYRWGLAAFREQERHQTEPGALIGLADKVLLADADKQARRVIYESSRRVAVVTAVVPIAFISVLFVLFENIRMIRRLAGTYGGRPGFIGGMRLMIRVILHIAATGAIALTDDLFGQFLGQDMMRRLSARLGEGAFNGALTARLGIASIELCRPCPHIASEPLRVRHVVSELFPEFRPGELINRAIGRKSDQGKPDRDQP